MASPLAPVPPVPAASDTFHSPEEIGQYAAWFDQRVNEYGAALSATNNTTNGQAILIDFLPWAAVWKAELAKLQVDLGEWGSGGIWSNPWAYVPGGQVANPLTGAWDHVRQRHSELIEFARRMQLANLATPELPGLPTAAPLGSANGPSSQTIAIFAGGVALLGAVVGWQVAPPPEKPVVALALAAVGAGITWYALR